MSPYYWHTTLLSMIQSDNRFLHESLRNFCWRYLRFLIKVHIYLTRETKVAITSGSDDHLSQLFLLSLIQQCQIQVQPSVLHMLVQRLLHRPRRIKLYQLQFSSSRDFDPTLSSRITNVSRVTFLLADLFNFMKHHLLYFVTHNTEWYISLPISLS